MDRSLHPSSRRHRHGRHPHASLLLAPFLALVSLAAFPARGSAAWPVDPSVNVPVCTVPGGRQDPWVVTDGAGGAIIVWVDFRSEPFYGDLYAQHVLSSGALDPTWPASGRAVSTLAGYQVNHRVESDGAGGAIVVWQNGQPGSFDLYAQHIRSTGVLDPGWPAAGRVISSATGDQQLPRTIADQAGGVFVFWQDHRSGNDDIYGHHVLGSGSLDAAWGADGRAICTVAGAQQYPRVASDGGGGCLVSWDDQRGADTDIYVQHVLANGALDAAWPATGARVCGATGQQFNGWPVSDGAGGAIVVWDDRRAGSSNTDVYAGHVLASGAVDLAWPTGGRGLAVAANDQYMDHPLADGTGGVFVCWEDRRSGTDYDIYAQHLLASGQLASGWNVNGSPLCTAAGDQRTPIAIADQAGGMIVTWTDRRGGASADIYATRVTGAGVTPAGVPIDGRPVSVAANDQANPWMATDGAGGAILTWQDLRTTSAGDVYAQNFEIDNDQDGLPDSWEVFGIPVGSGTARYLLPGADPNHRDLYVEVDAMTGWAPSQADLQRVVAAFDQSPVANPDGHPGVHLHIVGAGCDPCVSDAGLPHGALASTPWSQVHSLKTAWYGTAAERALPGWASIAAARAQAFRYCVFADNFSTEFSGICEGVGRDFIVTLGPFGDVDSDKRAGTFMHELGHSLGLRHGGGDDLRAKPNYFSVMNYSWQWPAAVNGRGSDMQSYRNSWRLDYSRSRLNTLDEAALVEYDGIGGDASRVVPVGPPRHGRIRDWLVLVPMGGAVDWNGDGTANDRGVALDLNYVGAPITPDPSPGQVLTPFDDWSNLAYAANESYTVAFPEPLLAAADSIDEMTPAIYDSINAMRFDCNGNGIDDGEEIASGAVADLNANGIPDSCEAPATLLEVGDSAPSRGGLTIVPSAGGGAHELRWAVLAHAPTAIGIFDLSGRRVARLVDDDLSLGPHRVVWSHVDEGGRQVDSGIYFVVLEGGGRPPTRGRIVVLR